MASLFDYFKIHVIVFIWGFTAILGLLISIPSVEMVFYRTLIASLGTAALLVIRKQSFSISITDFTKLSATGFLIAAHWIFFFLSARVSNASVSLVGFATIAIWTALLDPIINRKKISWLEVMLGFVVIIGLYIIFQEEVEHSLGLLIGIACGFFGAMFSVINVNFTRRISPYQITLYEMSGATLGIMLFLPIYKIYFASNTILMMSPQPTDWLYLLLLGLVCTVFPFSIWVDLLKRVSVFTANLSINLEPLYGIVLAVIFFPQTEVMRPGFYLGAIIILAAVFLYPLIKRWRRNLINT